ncbi:unnamed protein product [Parnassius mnemosyne]|uniref:DUF7869 domain-containing protein n=1 Tax=Parnassius mnemosyne TaxID=213953 RepID=A0AAV1KVS3_9NEOP
MDNRNRAKRIVNMALQSSPPPSSSTSTNEDFSSDHSSYHPQQNVEISTELEDSEDNEERRDPEGPVGNLGEINHPDSDEPVKGRKRVRNFDRWAKNIRKRKRTAGQEYRNVRGSIVPAKVFTPVVCSCRFKCSEQVSSENQEAIHVMFYQLTSWDAQTTWLCSAIMTLEPKRRKQRQNAQNPSRINYVRQFMLLDKRVCKSFFLKVIQISNKRLDYALRNKKSVSGIAERDKMGQHVPANKLSDEKLNWIKDHINSFPKFVSHYGERRSTRKYLRPDLSMNKMYELFKAKCESEGKPILKKSAYVKVFTTEFNIHFYIPKADTCKTCDILEIAVKAEEDIETCLAIRVQKDQHIKLAGEVRNILNDCKSKVKTEESLLVATFDLERTLPLPYLNTGEVYYLRQLQMLNFGIHAYTKEGEKVLMNMWPEHCGARGSQEIMSSLHYFLEDSVPDTVKSLCFFSDCCSGQNRNWNVLHFMMFLVNKSPYLESITMHYLVSGHTYLPNDTDFSFISRELKKKTDIYTPEDWMKLVRDCTKQKPFTVRDMKNKFLDYESLTTLFKDYQIVLREGAKISKMRKIKFCKGSSIISYNDDYTETYETVDLKPNDMDSGTFFCNLKNYIPEKAPETRLISYQKMQDIRKTLKFVPPIHHQFYLTLPHVPRRGGNQEAQDDVNFLPAVFGDD